MAETECPCRNFETLEQSAVRIYVTLYLEETGVDEDAGKIYYRCKYCGSPWTQEIINDSPMLKRMPRDYIA